MSRALMEVGVGAPPPMRAGRFTGLKNVLEVDVPLDLAWDWTWGMIRASNPHDPEDGHQSWRKWSDVDLDVFLISLCGGEA